MEIPMKTKQAAVAPRLAALLAAVPGGAQHSTSDYYFSNHAGGPFAAFRALQLGPKR